MADNAIEGLDVEAAKRNLTIVSRADPEWPQGLDFYDLSTPADQRIIAETVEAKGYGLVILDNISSLADRFTDENSNDEAKAFLRVVMAIKRVASVIVMHHSRKAQQGMKETFRGASALEFPFEFSMGLLRIAADDDRRDLPGGRIDGAGFTISISKPHRDRVEVNALEGLAFLLGDFGHWLPVLPAEGQRVLPANAKVTDERLRAAVTSRRFRTQRQLADYLGVNPSQITRRMRGLGLTLPEPLEGLADDDDDEGDF